MDIILWKDKRIILGIEQLKTFYRRETYKTFILTYIVSFVT